MFLAAHHYTHFEMPSRDIYEDREVRVNNHNLKRYVIAISGASGTGKSTLVKALVQTLGNAVPLYFDDYKPQIVATSHYPIDLVKWVADGADPNAWETPQLS